MNTRLNRASRRAALSAAVLLLLATGGCANLSQVPDVEVVKAEPIRWPQPPRAGTVEAVPTGSLFASANYRPGFEDPRARLVGDSLTIQIAERVTASQKSSSTANRASGLEGSVTAFPFLKSTLLDKLSAGAETSNTFKGDGATDTANTFTGAITATVVEVLPNGHLVVVGEKQIGVNQNVDVLRFSGTVDPRTIAPGNTVQSTQIANTRVESRGRGAQFDAQTFGWLSRFFLTLLPF
ncbi:MAG: flagellar basal body L-ring protein FlgH [Hydrogenophaga sp.]|nr:flagellar basal body L-ring protein FlgH [Hydrogenophaga sp.]